MKEWILENTDITEDTYNSIINPNTINIKGKPPTKLYYTKNKTFDNPLLAITTYAKEKPNILRNIFFRIKKQDKNYLYQGIKFNILEEILKSFDEHFYHEQRLGKCIEISSSICFHYKDTNILTIMGMNPYYKEPKPFLHCVIQITSDKFKEYIIDGAYNIMMEKKLI